ncbi:hypothetical protein [Nocardioides sp.]|uniref:hypothetical protein n=1 Tax=Nocardioides sp. TaxID=35761 RepID=UPI003D09D00F
MRRILLLVVAVSLVSFAPVAIAEPSSAVGARTRAIITFNKDAEHPHRSTLVWRVQKRGAGGVWSTVERESWRAGSGFEGRLATNECAKGKGWLPNGKYSVIQYDDYWGQLIKGRAFYLGNKRCRNGTLRTELFIHTETGSGNKQCRNARGDQICRWEYPAVNDYKSYGCIKMSPHDLRALVRRYHEYFRAGVRYGTAKVKVRVIA